MGFESTTDGVTYLLSPRAIRERSSIVFNFVKEGCSPYFSLELANLSKVVALVIDEIRKNYPDMKVPYHSRWRHFSVGGIDREAVLTRLLSGTSRRQAVMAKIELAIVSVLLDAGAGSSWRFHEPEMEEEYSRSEGLAVASFHAFTCGRFGTAPLRVDASALQIIDEGVLNDVFQVSPQNPILGVAGRAFLLRQLGVQIEKRKDLFPGDHARLGNLINYLVPEGIPSRRVSAPQILSFILNALGPIWPGRILLGDIPMGDVWTHPAIQTDDVTNTLIPFHKLSQWLTYSLCEPLQELCGVIEGVDQLTGLAEYRNGGLFVDGGVLNLKDSANHKVPHLPSSQLVVEWRACTICLLDMVAEQIRTTLGFTSAEFPLAKVLQGGTWNVGRNLAQSLRPDGSPPISIESDGTVF